MNNTVEILATLYRKSDDLNAKTESLEAYSLEYRNYLKEAHDIYEEVRAVLKDNMEVLEKEIM